MSENLSRKLYIIGNGFDLAHGLETSCSDFRDYLHNKDSNFAEELEGIYGKEELWSNFEYALGKPNVMTINQLEKLFNLNIIDQSFAERIGNELYQWILNVNEEINDKSRKYAFQEDSLFFTFNYSMTLELLYEISNKRILHIHNFVSLKYPHIDIVFGHNNLQTNPIILNYTRKDVGQIIFKNQSWFDFIKNVHVKTIEVIGHSYNSIDYLYYEKINEMLPNVFWIFNCYSQRDEDNLQIMLKNIKIDRSRYKIV